MGQAGDARPYGEVDFVLAALHLAWLSVAADAQLIKAAECQGDPVLEETLDDVSCVVSACGVTATHDWRSIGGDGSSMRPACSDFNISTTQPGLLVCADCRSALMLLARPLSCTSCT
jgi:hypothetical protein